ncbi:MAG: GNAT family N-acetyltransferase [Oscillospiraceae bacterium]|nr:GNAT family N-acetyltransferase [Oscillospiraceae bacterium]
MNHIGTQYIETERLILRRFEPSDAPAMFANWASDDEVTKFLTWPTHADVSVTEGILGQWVPQYEKDDYYNWAIVLKEHGSQPIGNINVAHWSEDREAPEIGYCMGRRWWHRGIMTEALGAVLDFLFERVGVEQIVALHDTNNPHSGGVMRKCGMVFDGVQEKAGKNNQGVVDMARYVLKAGDR